MKAYVVIATKGRPKETEILVRDLAAQTLRPSRIVVVGSNQDDIEGVREGFDTDLIPLDIIIQDPPGLPRQRNAGTDVLIEQGLIGADVTDAFVTFYDDDFRPRQDWLDEAAKVFQRDENILGLTGVVLADGVKYSGLTEAEAADYIAGQLPPQKHWTTSETEREMDSAYGCNMAFRANVFETCRFDENLPMYAWQEDRDFTGQVRRYGRVILTPPCKGVHLGVKGGRQSGVRFGYSQVANPIYLADKGTISAHRKRMFLARAFAANILFSLKRSEHADYPGRLRGNLLAVRDFFQSNLKPQNILSL